VGKRRGEQERQELQHDAESVVFGNGKPESADYSQRLGHKARIRILEAEKPRRQLKSPEPFSGRHLSGHDASPEPDAQDRHRASAAGQKEWPDLAAQ